MFGVEISFEDVETNIDAVTIPRVEDNLEIIDTGYSLALPTKKSAYAEGADINKGTGNIVFCEELGLAIEQPSNGMSID